MSKEEPSTFIISLSGKKGEGPWIALDGAGYCPTPNMSDAWSFDTRAEARDLLGWARIEYGKEAKVMGVRTKKREEKLAPGSTYDVWLASNHRIRADEFAMRDSAAAIEFVTRFDLAKGTVLDVCVQKYGEGADSRVTLWRVESIEGGWVATREGRDTEVRVRAAS